MKRVITFTILLTIAWNASGNARAGILGTQTASFSNQLLDLAGSPALTLNDYNGPGTVQEVQISVSASITSSGTFVNKASVAQTFNVSVEIGQFDVDATGSDPSALQNLINGSTGGTFSPFSDSNVSLIGSHKFTSLAAGGTGNFGPYTVNGLSTADFTATTDVAGFIGSGSFTFDSFSAIGYSIAGGGGLIISNLTDTASVSVTVNYIGADSSSVPEPSSLVMMGLGIVLTSAAAWKNRREVRLAA